MKRDWMAAAVGRKSVTVTHRLTRLTREPMLAGIAPSRLLLPSERDVSFTRFPRELGMVPK
jgi:hypothetical protein